MKQVTFKEVLKDASARAKVETPPFFERIKGWAKTAAWFCGGIGAVGLGVLTTCASFGVALPIYVTIGVGVLVGAGTLGAGVGIGGAKVAQMTTTNKELLARPSNK
jgi:hypothetical protein